MANYVKSCLLCQRTRPGPERLQGYFRPHPEAGPFENIYVDIWVAKWKEEKYHVLTMIDRATRWVEATVLTSKTAACISSALLQTWISRFGIPRKLITDNELAFMSETFVELCRILGTDKLTTTVYHPEGNAPIEAFHKTLKKGFVSLQQVGHQLADFGDLLQLILMSYRLTCHGATGESPAFLALGIDLAPEGH